MKNLRFLTVAAVVCTLATGCQSGRLTESQRFERSVRQELPFPIDSLCWLDGTGIASFRFVNRGYTPAAPDAEISPEGMLSLSNIFGLEERGKGKEERSKWKEERGMWRGKRGRQDSTTIWRNIVVSKRNQRVICLDRYVRSGRTMGYGYVLQSDSRKYPSYGAFHWDVSDPRNMEFVGGTLTDLRGLALRRGKMDVSGWQTPSSQEEYWRLVFHADSLFDTQLYGDARRMYDLAFAEDRYVLPSQLSSVARKMADIGADSVALAYLRRRVALEKDFYEDPERCSRAELRDTFVARSRRWNYDIALKEELESVFERDQYCRQQWQQAANSHPQQPERTEELARKAIVTDSINLALVSDILTRKGFPNRAEVGEWATMAVWLVFQHSELDLQKQFLPQLEAAVAAGEIAPAYLAMLRDRIDVREGRPQKYGTQTDAKGRLAPLLDASRLNEWRQEVGLPPVDD